MLNPTSRRPAILHPTSSDELLPAVSRWTTWGAVALVVTVVTAVVLAGSSRYHVKVQATATVRPTGDLRLVQPEMEGTVKQLAVQSNQAVRKGDVIAYLDDSQLQTKKSQLLDSLQQDDRQLANLTAQLQALESQIGAEEVVVERTIASAQAELNRSQRDYQDKQGITQVDVQEAAASLDLATDQYDRYRQLAEAGAVSQVQVREKEAAVKSATARMSRAEISLQPSDAGVTIAQQQIAQQQAKGTSVVAALRKEREGLLQQQVQLQTQHQKNQRDLNQTDLDLRRSEIRATSDGIILQLTLRNPGQVVRPGEAIAQIAPSNLPLIIKANVATQDIEKVHVGQRVQMRVMACPYPDYGTLEGVVSALTPDTVASHQGGAIGQSGSMGPSFFEATIQPSQRILKQGDRSCTIQSGMEAQADIITREETVLQFMLRKARLQADL
jgi:HlyD family type I secretion membrane fusion protein